MESPRQPQNAKKRALDTPDDSSCRKIAEPANKDQKLELPSETNIIKKRRVVSSGYGTEEDTTSENIERSMLKRKRSDEDTNPDEPVKSRFRFGDLDKYQKIIQIGEGTFGRVYKAREHSTRKIFAIKEFVMSKGDYKTDVGLRITMEREIALLSPLKHENVVNVIEVCRTANPLKAGPRFSFALVLDFCAHDLAGLINEISFNLAETKCIMKQVLSALFFIHYQKIMHRDLKPANILVTKDGVIKLADFGLARTFKAPVADQRNNYTTSVVTLAYRPPELLLGQRNYGPEVDMWAAGCILAELFTKKIIMPGRTEHSQLTLITNLCGSITPKTMPGVEELKIFKSIRLPTNLQRKVKKHLGSFIRNAEGLDLVDKLLQINPSQRIDVDAALDHDFFWTDPLPKEISSKVSKLTRSIFASSLVNNAEPAVPAPLMLSYQNPQQQQEYARNLRLAQPQ